MKNSISKNTTKPLDIELLKKLNQSDYPDEFFDWFYSENINKHRFSLIGFVFLINTMNYPTHKEFKAQHGGCFNHPRFIAAVNQVKKNVSVELDSTYGMGYINSHNYAKYMFAKLYEYWQSTHS